MNETEFGTLRTPLDCLLSLSLGSLNTVYAVRFAHPNYAFGTTSQTPIPLYEIQLGGLTKNKRIL
jgi:hypothetical protein